MRPATAFLVISGVLLVLAMSAILLAGKRLRSNLDRKSSADPLSDLTKEQLAAILKNKLATPLELAKMRPSERAMLAVAAMRLEGR